MWNTSGKGTRVTVDMEMALEHEHDWQLVSVDYEGEAPVREFLCHGCTEVWFAS